MRISISKVEESKICDQCEGDHTQDSEHMRYCTKYWSQREIIFGNERPDLRLITDFPWFPPTEGDIDEEYPDQQSVCSQDAIPPCCRSPIRPTNIDPHQTEKDETDNESDNPGYDLFDADSDNEQESIPDEFNLPPSDNEDEDDSNLDHFLISPNDNPLPVMPNRGHLGPTSNWLQSSSENGSDLDHDQFLLNANDMYSDDAWSSCSASDTQGNNTGWNDDFETNDQYIDDELIPQ